MNKTAIKNFAVWARQKLISDITYKAGMLGITEDGIADKLPHSTSDLEFYDIGTKDYAEVSGKEIKQRNALVNAIRKKEKDNGDYKSAFGYVVEEVAYTWFNRLIAIRFMEVNDYLPSGVRVLSSENKAKKEPDLVTAPFDTDLEFTSYEQDRIIQLKDDNKLDELFRMLFIKQCNKLHDVLPELFEKTDDYSELLLTVSFTDSDGVLYHLVHDIEEDDFNVEKEGQVQIIGWLYQFYNTELKDDTFAQLKKKVKITKERIPAATQLFTPDWIVRYMVENSLGRLWLEGHPNAKLHDSWKYYLDEARQEQSVEVQLQALRAEYKTIKLEEIKVIDPCMGSGHILVYAFDVLMQIYLECGYTEREAVSLILQNNLFGLDIDDRAYQLAYFAVMMKARQYDRRFLTRGIQPNLYPIQESNGIQAMTVEYFHKNDPKLKADMESIITEMQDAKEYGSILNITPVDFAGLYARFDEISNDFSIQYESVRNQLLPLVKCAEVLAHKYDVVVTNPPYMGSAGMNTRLLQYIKDHFPDEKADLFSCFIERGFQFANVRGFVSMITMESWMFLSSFEKMRQNIVNTHTIVNMVHMPYLGKGGTSLGINFGTAAVIFNKRYCRDYNSQFDYICYYETDENGVPFAFPTVNERYKAAKAANFSKIPGSPIAYWASNHFVHIFEGAMLYDVAQVQEGLKTGDNDRFIRFWNEVDFKKTLMSGNSNAKWTYHTKGGDYKKWYGNQEYILNFQNDGEELRAYKGSSLTGYQNYGKANISYSRITSAKTAFRYTAEGAIPNMAGLAIYTSDDLIFYILGWLNTEIVCDILSLTNPTINFPPGTIGRLPILIDDSFKSEVSSISKNCVEQAKQDWDSYETSWDFKRNPLV